MEVWKVLSDCDMVYAIERERERWIRSLLLHRRIRDCVLNGARMIRIEIDVKIRLALIFHTCTKRQP